MLWGLFNDSVFSAELIGTNQKITFVHYKIINGMSSSKID